MQVVVIKRHATDSWVAPPPIFVAVAENEEAAKQWIQDEVDGKHNSGCSYASGQSADWWIEYGTFSLMWVEVHKNRESLPGLSAPCSDCYADAGKACHPDCPRLCE